jgi:hypothetical protein
MISAESCNHILLRIGHDPVVAHVAHHFALVGKRALNFLADDASRGSML